MQKLFTLIFISTLCIFCACQPSKDTYRNDFVKTCVTSYARDSAVANTEGRKLVEQYCNSIGDKMNEQMDANQWRVFNKSGDTSLSKFKNEIEPFKEQFEAKVAALKKK